MSLPAVGQHAIHMTYTLMPAGYVRAYTRVCMCPACGQDATEHGRESRPDSDFDSWALACQTCGHQEVGDSSETDDVPWARPLGALFGPVSVAS